MNPTSAPVPAQRRKRPTGRRAGDSGTRDALLDAARDLFAEHGYDGASLRAIAARADVDPALIRHFFGDKERLFAETMADRTVIPERMAAALAGPRGSLGERVADAYLRLWEEEDTRPLLLGLVRSATSSVHGAESLLEVLIGRVQHGSVAPALGEEGVSGFALAASHLFGTAVARVLLKVPALAEPELEQLVARVAPVIQAYFEPAGDPTHP